MIHIYIPGLGKPAKETRYGDGQIINDGTNYLVIDGFCGKGTDILIKKLKAWKVVSPILAISHSHYDHTYGISKILKDSYFKPKVLYCYDPASLEVGLTNNKGSKQVKSDINNLKTIISLAKSKNVPVKYLKHNQTVTQGDIKFKVFRKQPTKITNEDSNGWDYVNQGSLCFYFYEIGYWTSGDGPAKIYDFIKSCNANVKFFKIPHHGNNCSQSQAEGLYKMGVRFCWYNDLEPKGVGTNNFTQYGARRCKQAGITVLDSFSDINIIAIKKKVYIYHNAKQLTTYACSYNGETKLKNPSVAIVRNVFMNKYGAGDTRITNLIRAGYYPKATNDKVSTVINTAKKIINGQVNYGTNETRTKKIDSLLGTGYGQLVQDEINSLLNSKVKKW